MLLAVDVGNTNITLGVFDKERILRRYSIPTYRRTYRRGLLPILRSYPIENAIISSVVPYATAILKKELFRQLGKKPLVLGLNIKVPITNRYRKRRQVGQDRLVNAYAVCEFYGPPAVVVDFGTAVTFDVVSRRGEYLGGMILPGLRMSLAALAEKTALLPDIKLKRPKEFIGRDTAESILSGVVHGFAAMTRDMIRSIRGAIGNDAIAVFTGGDSALLAQYIKEAKRLDADLTIKGLNLIYSRKYLTRGSV
ncbi:MAG: type III pantothenate kinase [Candidatus Omnitrophota bacterium]